MHDHSWYVINGDGETTIEYLKKRISEGISIVDAMNEIRGLNHYQVQARLLGYPEIKYKITLDPINGLVTINHIRQRPEGVPVEKAMRNILGLNHDQIHDVDTHMMLGRDLGLNETELCSERFDQNCYAKIVRQIAAVILSDPSNNFSSNDPFIAFATLKFMDTQEIVDKFIHLDTKFFDYTKARAGTVFNLFKHAKNLAPQQVSHSTPHNLEADSGRRSCKPPCHAKWLGSWPCEALAL
ncbi:MAG: hypothetical protein ACJAUP_003763 [Cellvibrionaceae bacterium]|jgi:hypothetical protein